jgi:hypothetical protein
VIRILVAVLAMTTLAACASLPNPLDAPTRQALFVKDVSVAWSFDDAKQGAKPDYVAYKEDTQKRLKSAVATAFATSPAGAEGVAFKIDVKEFSCATTGCQVKTDVAVVRMSDGKELGVYKDVMGIQAASGGGLLGVLIQAMVKPDVVGIMSNNYALVLHARFDAKT